MNLAFFASHRGSNMQAVVDACHSGRLSSCPKLLISNNRNGEALARAEAAGIASYVYNAKTHPEPVDLDRVILGTLLNHQIDLIVLAGYMKCLGPQVVGRFRDRILNIHPALLPKYGGRGMYGLHVHQAVLAAEERETGVTVHLVDEEYDHGRVLAQAVIPVLPGDTLETLSARVLRREHEFLVEVLAGIEGGRIVLSSLKEDERTAAAD